MKTFGLVVAILLHWQVVFGQENATVDKSCPDMTAYDCVSTLLFTILRPLGPTN